MSSSPPTRAGRRRSWPATRSATTPSTCPTSRAIGARPPRLVGVGAEAGVQHEVVEGAAAELGAAADALAGEAGLLEGARLGEVVDVGRGLDAVGAGRLEEPVGEQPLGLGAQALAAALGHEIDADHPRLRLDVRAVAHLVIRDRSDD